MKFIILKKNKIWLILATVLMAIFIFLMASLSVGGFVKTNAPIYSAKENSGSVGLMFNVYGGSEYIPKILETLEKHNAKATFFVGGVWVLKNTQDFLKIAESGNEVGNHGYFHKDHKNLTESQNEEEIMRTHNLVKQTCNIEMNLFAPPSGSYGKATLKVAQNLNYKTIMWSTDTIDWRDQNTDLIISRATKNLKAGNLILMHPTKCTADALETIITKINMQNLRCDIVSNII